jgi:hypothetical protein
LKLVVLVVVLEIFTICPLNPRNKFVRSKIELFFEVLKNTKSGTSTSTTTRTISEFRNLGSFIAGVLTFAHPGIEREGPEPS